MKKLLNGLKESIYDMKIWQIILIVMCLAVVPSCAGYLSYKASVNRIANEQKNQEELQEKQAVDDITVKYKLALQAKSKKEWNKVIDILNSIDADIVDKNVEAFRAEYGISNDKGLKATIMDKKRWETQFASGKNKKEIEDKYDRILEIKPVTNSQIVGLKRFAEGMIEYENGNYEKADYIFNSINVYVKLESDIVDEDYKIIEDTARRLTVKMPVKIVNATWRMEYNNKYREEEPYYTITIENPLDEPVYISQLVESAVNTEGERALYSYPFDYYHHKNIDLDIPAKSKTVYKCRVSVFLGNIKYYLLSIDDFYLKESKKNYKDIEKHIQVEAFKVEAK